MNWKFLLIILTLIGCMSRELNLPDDLKGVGVACISNDGGQARIDVDFGDCLFCVTPDVYCQVRTSGNQIVVESGGSVEATRPCKELGTCESIAAHCGLVSLSPGIYKLEYSGVALEISWPLFEHICTDNSALL